MKRLNVLVPTLVALVLLATFACTAEQTPSRQIYGPLLNPGDPALVLFIGNSHIFMNDLPQMLSELATSAGIVNATDHISYGGYQLSQHAVNEPTLSLIEQEPWDVVVLQESTSIRLETLANEMEPAVIALDKAIGAVGGQTLLLMMWAPYLTALEDGAFHEHQEELARITIAIAERISASVAPVGLAWEEVQDTHEAIHLWSYDRVHAAEAGTYLIACVLLATIWEQSPVGLAFTAGLSETDALALQTAAARAAFAGRAQAAD